MKLQWTQTAIADLVEARAFIEADNPEAARELADRLLEAAQQLLDLPSLGRKGRSRSTRERPVADTPYILIYRVFVDRVQILRVYHGRRRWPPARPSGSRAG